MLVISMKKNNILRKSPYEIWCYFEKQEFQGYLIFVILEILLLFRKYFLVWFVISRNTSLAYFDWTSFATFFKGKNKTILFKRILRDSVFVFKASRLSSSWKRRRPTEMALFEITCMFCTSDILVLKHLWTDLRQIFNVPFLSIFEQI